MILMSLPWLHLILGLSAFLTPLKWTMRGKSRLYKKLRIYKRQGLQIFGRAWGLAWNYLKRSTTKIKTSLLFYSRMANPISTLQEASFQPSKNTLRSKNCKLQIFMFSGMGISWTQSYLRKSPEKEQGRLHTFPTVQWLEQCSLTLWQTAWQPFQIGPFWLLSIQMALRSLRY